MIKNKFCFFLASWAATQWMGMGYCDGQKTASSVESDPSQKKEQSPQTAQKPPQELLDRARSTVEGASRTTKDILRKPGTDAEKKGELASLIQRDFNFAAIAKHGCPCWKQLSDAEKKEFIELFKKDMVEIYFNLLKRYYEKEETLVVLRVEPSQRDKNACDVYAEARNPDTNRKVTLKFQILNGKILDITVGGASMANTKTREYKDLMRKSGRSAPGFLKALSEKVARMSK